MGADAQTKLTIGQRITAITAALAPIEATGKNRFRGTALSVEDIEDALRPLFAQHGVLALWTILSDEKWDEKTSEGFMTIWRLNFRIRLMCDDAVDDEAFIEADWFDIGTSPSAAESFAVKGYYRRLFHIASAEDEGASAASQPRRSRESEYNGAPVTDAPITSTRKSPLEGLPPGFTQEAWDEIKKMANAAKQASTDVQWNGSGLSTPAKVKARVSVLYAEPNDDAGGFPLDVATRIAWAVENIKGELEAISTSDPNAADKQRPGAFSFAALGREVPTATDASPDTANGATVAVAAPSEAVDEEALRKAVIASG